MGGAASSSVPPRGGAPALFAGSLPPGGRSPAARLAFTLIIVFLWYSSNIGVLLLNKWLLSSTPFKQPVFLTLCHMLACATLGYVLSLGDWTPIKPLRSKRQLGKVCALSALFCTTIVLGNLSLKYIPVSFNQMLGAMTPVFTAFFAALLMSARETPMTYLTLAPVVGGVVVASGAEPAFHLLGFVACVSATAGRALKSVVQSMLLTDAAEKLDPMSLLFYMSCFSVLLLLPATAILEPTAFATTRALVEASPGFFWWLLGNSCLAYAVNLTNFLVTKYTSALTLQVLGNCKGVIAAVVSVLLFKNKVTPRGMLGYAVTVAGVFLYSESKRRGKLRVQAAQAAQAAAAAAAGAAGSGVGAGLGGAGVGGVPGSGVGGAASGGGLESGLHHHHHHHHHNNQQALHQQALLKAMAAGKGSDGGAAGVTSGGGMGGGSSVGGASSAAFAPALKGRAVAQQHQQHHQHQHPGDLESSMGLLSAGGGGGGGGGPGSGTGG
jgi:drug/metabolite transporter (DMT)-like permease